MSNHLYKVEGHQELIKDRGTGAVLLSDRGIADEYKAKKAMLQKTRDMGSEINNIKAEVSEIKSDMKDIKDLLQRIASK